MLDFGTAAYRAAWMHDECLEHSATVLVQPGQRSNLSCARKEKLKLTSIVAYHWVSVTIQQKYIDSFARDLRTLPLLYHPTAQLWNLAPTRE